MLNDIRNARLLSHLSDAQLEHAHRHAVQRMPDEGEFLVTQGDATE